MSNSNNKLRVVWHRRDGCPVALRGPLIVNYPLTLEQMRELHRQLGDKLVKIQERELTEQMKTPPAKVKASVMKQPVATLKNELANKEYQDRFEVGDKVQATNRIWRQDRRTMLVAGDTATVSNKYVTKGGVTFINLELPGRCRLPICDLIVSDDLPLRKVEPMPTEASRTYSEEVLRQSGVDTEKIKGDIKCGGE